MHWAPRGLVTITKKPARDLKESMDYFIIMIYLFFYRIKLHNAIIWFLFELYSKKIFFTQWVKTKFPFPLNVLSPIPSTKIPVPVDQIPFSHPYFRPIPVPFYPFRTLCICYEDSCDVSSACFWLAAFCKKRQVLSIGDFPSNKKIKAWFSLAHKRKHKHKHMCKQVKTGSA